jgi:hypothetical protein
VHEKLYFVVQAWVLGYIRANAPAAVPHAITGLATIDVDVALPLPPPLTPKRTSCKSQKLTQSTLSNDANAFPGK